jgi:hypothetical protein
MGGIQMQVVVIKGVFDRKCNTTQGHWPHWTEEGWCPGRSGHGIVVYHHSQGVMVVDRWVNRLEEEYDYFATNGMDVELMESDLESDLLYFEGTRRHCGNQAPHRPHVTGTYPTVRWGRLEYYCPGTSGDGLVVGEDGMTGDAQVPSRSRFRVAVRRSS